MITFEVHTVNKSDGTELNFPANKPLYLARIDLVGAIEEHLNSLLDADWSSVVVTIVRKG